MCKYWCFKASIYEYEHEQLSSTLQNMQSPFLMAQNNAHTTCNRFDLPEDWAVLKLCKTFVAILSFLYLLCNGGKL